MKTEHQKHNSPDLGLTIFLAKQRAKLSHDPKALAFLEKLEPGLLEGGRAGRKREGRTLQAGLRRHRLDDDDGLGNGGGRAGEGEGAGSKEANFSPSSTQDDENRVALKNPPTAEPEPRPRRSSLNYGAIG
jgi:hypothetical protein